MSTIFVRRISYYHLADEFSEYVKELQEAAKVTQSLFEMDTEEADNIYRIYRLCYALYPLAVVVALLIGALLPTLIILQSSKDAAVMRVLGTTKTRTRVIFALEQAALCVVRVAAEFASLALLHTVRNNGLALSLYFAAHLAMCAAAAVLNSAHVTKRSVIELLQVKE